MVLISSFGNLHIFFIICMDLFAKSFVFILRNLRKHFRVAWNSSSPWCVESWQGNSKHRPYRVQVHHPSRVFRSYKVFIPASQCLLPRQKQGTKNTFLSFYFHVISMKYKYKWFSPNIYTYTLVPNEVILEFCSGWLYRWWAGRWGVATGTGAVGRQPWSSPPFLTWGNPAHSRRRCSTPPRGTDKWF